MAVDTVLIMYRDACYISDIESSAKEKRNTNSWQDISFFRKSSSVIRTFILTTNLDANKLLLWIDALVVLMWFLAGGPLKPKILSAYNIYLDEYL